ncbi:MAG: deoxynucleoside kinase [Thiobacillaceae bacterium]|nr:deoxynucleoside kinase [Thiobacillaceae bacterium]MCX7672859.1 deoxynucleoside kinase [Thiobacillaceae bacterium]MDW8324765.1 deoxynucleoside kinase [Burkholderiales bacterium]
MTPERYRYIAVEGPIGAGKTSLALKLAQLFDAEPLLEAPEQNPFLPRFYEDRRRYALPTQLAFLLARHEQMRVLIQGDLFRRAHVADFLPDKDPLFARLTLDEAEFRLYQKIWADLAPRPPAPDLVIYLQAPPATLLERVRQRGRSYERGIDLDYLTALSEAYARFFYHYEAAPVLIVNSEHLDFVGRAEDFELLVRRIHDMRGAREFFNRGA